MQTLLVQPQLVPQQLHRGLTSNPQNGSISRIIWRLITFFPAPILGPSISNEGDTTAQRIEIICPLPLSFF